MIACSPIDIINQQTCCTERPFLPEEAVIKVENECAQISAAVLAASQSYLKLLIKVK